MNSPPSVLLVLPWSLDAAGGVNQVVINLAREAARQGRLRPIIFCADWSQDTFDSGERDGITVVSGRLRAPLSTSRSIRTPAAFVRTLARDLRSWRDFLRRHNVQVINAHFPGLNYFIFALLRGLDRRRFRLVYSLHGADLTEITQAGPFRRALLRRMLRRADGITCCSDDLLNRARHAIGPGGGRLLTAYNGIDVGELEQAQGSAFRPDTPGFDSYLVNVATYEPKKGQDVLLRAYASLVSAGLKSALVLIGRSTAYLDHLRRLAQELDLQDRVFFLPDLEHRHALAAIRGARVLVQASREEPFGITLLEAAYLGTPVVATRTGGIPEVLGTDYPYLAPRDDPSALAAKIDEVLGDSGAVERDADRLKRRVLTRFTWRTAYRVYEELWLGSG